MLVRCHPALEKHRQHITRTSLEMICNRIPERELFATFTADEQFDIRVRRLMCSYSNSLAVTKRFGHSRQTQSFTPSCR